MIDTVTDGPGIIQGFLRALSIFDRVAFGILEVAYRLFFLITSSVDVLIDSATVAKFYGRIQLVLGVFMMFQLAITILKGIMDPNSFTNEKTGAGNIIMRVMTSLLILTLIVPINIANPSNDYEKDISSNGILFGTLYSLQTRILENNTLAKLILGDGDVGAFSASKKDSQGLADSEEMKKSSRILTSTLVKVFYRINLKEGKTDDQNQSNYMCNESYADYKKVDVEPQKIIGMVDDTCMVGLEKRYKLTYVPIIPALLGGLFAALFISFIIDIVIRAAKLAFLRLLAPIPVISYMDPNGSKDSAFNSWVKLLTSTYLDLFTRLLVLYFSVFLILRIFNDGSVAFIKGGGFMGALVNIIIAIGLLVFAKDAPKFLKQMLGIKDDKGRGFFQGVGEIAAGAAIGMGAISSFAASARGADLSARQGKLGIKDSDNFWQKAAKVGVRGVGAGFSGLFGAATGVGSGTIAALTAKDHAARAARNAMAERNASAIEFGYAGGSTIGAVGSEIQEFFTGKNAADDIKAQEEKLKADELKVKKQQLLNSYRKSAMDRAKSKAKDSDKTTGTYKGITGNYRLFHAAYEAAINHGTGVHTQYRDASGTAITRAVFDGLSAADQAKYTEESWFDFNGQRINLAEANSIDLGLYDKNTADFYEKDGYGDASIIGYKKAFQDANDGVAMEAVFDGATGMKAKFGEVETEISRENTRISDERVKLNSSEASRKQANAKRFKARRGK